MNIGYQSKLKSVRRETAAIFICSACLNGFQRERHDRIGQSPSVSVADYGQSSLIQL